MATPPSPNRTPRCQQLRWDRHSWWPNLRNLMILRRLINEGGCTWCQIGGRKHEQLLKNLTQKQRSIYINGPPQKKTPSDPFMLSIAKTMTLGHLQLARWRSCFSSKIAGWCRRSLKIHCVQAAWHLKWLTWADVHSDMSKCKNAITKTIKYPFKPFLLWNQSV